MGDLFNLIYDRRKFTYSAFWGRYSKYNNVKTFSENILLNYQIKKLKAFKKGNERFENVNRFLDEINKQPLEKSSQEIENMSEQQIYTRILEILNSGLFSSDLNPKHKTMDKVNSSLQYKPGQDKNTTKEYGLKLIEELELLSGMIKSTRLQKRVQRLLHAYGGFGIKKKSLKDGFDSYVRYKANEAEILTVEALSQKSLGWRALQTGRLYNQGQQLLEDAFVFDDTINIDFGTGYTIGLKSKNTSYDKKVSSLNEFFSLIESLSTSVSVHIPDELYDKMKEISLLTAQTKSGVGFQSLLNETVKRNAIGINEIGEQMFLKDFQELFKDGWIDSNSESETLSALANLWLSKNIIKTNIVKNEIYFTREGFITADWWMEKHKQMLKFNPYLSKMSNSYFVQPHPYQFQSPKN